MPLEKETQGLELKEYKSKLQNDTYALRVGKEVPEGDINLAYIHTPRVQSDENISLIDTSYTSDNVIPQDQMESMVVANSQGELEYVDIIGNGEVQTRPPKDTFPSNKINITSKFKKNEMRTENALYYKFEIDYHYDSRAAMPNEKGEYAEEKYTGQQIDLTDENGNLLDDTYKYDIYVVPQSFNPRIYQVRIYLHKNTNKIDTIKVRYNHIDRVVKDEHVQSSQRSIEFYSNKDNTITVNGQSRQMLEGGKLRIVNGSSAFKQRPENEVREALLEGDGQEIFAVIPKDNGEGYKIIVPQKSESDPRAPRIFSHRVVAEYTGSDNQTVKVSVGHITDWCINPEALLKHEREDYSGDWKNLGMPADGAKLNAKEMIELSLPIGAPSIPSEAKFYIEDDNGNLLYSITNMTDNSNVDTQINEIMSKAVEAKANNLNQAAWKNAMQNNTVIKNNPILNRCTIIPERQQTKWNFTWQANGQGYIQNKVNETTPWTTDDNGLSVVGTGTVEYHADGHYTIITSPNRLPSEQIPEGVLGFKWNNPWITSGENINISLIEPNKLQLTATPSPILTIGQPYVLKDNEIVKSDDYKHLEFLFDTSGEEGFYEKLEIPTNIPKDEILLRIERGVVTGIGPDGAATVENADYRVNYRFRCQKDGFTRMPVDQFQDQIGVNRLRLKSILKDGEFDSSINVDVVAWTTFQELEAVPLFAVKVEEQRKIEIEKPKIEHRNMEIDNWYMRVKNGRFLKRLILPYYEVGSLEKPPEVYVAYPELLGMVANPDEIVEVDLEYSLPEYTNQEFHNRPHVLVNKETPVILNEYAIQTRYSPLVLESETGGSYLEVYSIRANQRRELRVADVDAVKGVIYLHDRMREQDDVFVRYAYKEDWYTYRGYINYEETQVPAPGVLGFSAVFDAKLTASITYETEENGPAIQLTTSLPVVAGGKYCYSNLQNETAPFVLRITDDTQIESWSATATGSWSSSDHLLADGVITDTGNLSLNIPVSIPAKVLGTYGGLYTPDSTITVSVEAVDVYGNVSTKNLTITLTDCEYEENPPVISLAANIQPDATGKYCYSDLATNNIPLTLRVTDGSGVESWIAESSTIPWSQEQTYPSAVTDTGNIVLTIPIPIPASATDRYGAQYIPDSSHTIKVTAKDKYGNPKVQTITLSFYDCTYQPMSVAGCASGSWIGVDPGTHVAYYNIGTNPGEVTIQYNMGTGTSQIDVYTGYNFDKLVASTGKPITGTGPIKYLHEGFEYTDQIKVVVTANAAMSYEVRCSLRYNSVPPHTWDLKFKFKWGYNDEDTAYRYSEFNLTLRETTDNAGVYYQYAGGASDNVWETVDGTFYADSYGFGHTSIATVDNLPSTMSITGFKGKTISIGVWDGYSFAPFSGLKPGPLPAKGVLEILDANSQVLRIIPLPDDAFTVAGRYGYEGERDDLCFYIGDVIIPETGDVSGYTFVPKEIRGRIY